MKLRINICQKLYISSKSQLTLKKIDVKLDHDWFAARSEGRIFFESDEPNFSYPFGGTLEDVKDWIAQLPKNVKNFFTWVPKEFVIDHLLQNKSYPQ